MYDWSAVTERIEMAAEVLADLEMDQDTEIPAGVMTLIERLKGHLDEKW